MDFFTVLCCIFMFYGAIGFFDYFFQVSCVAQKGHVLFYVCFNYYQIFIGNLTEFD
jgi:hypothetical protein